ELEEVAHPAADHRVVVDQQDPDPVIRGLAHPGMVGPRRHRATRGVPGQPALAGSPARSASSGGASFAATIASASADSGRAPPIRMLVNGTRNWWNTSIDTRNPAKRNTTPRNLPIWNGAVSPNRFRLSVRVGMSAPIAMRIVAGTRLWIRPPMSALTAPG